MARLEWLGFLLILGGESTAEDENKDKGECNEVYIAPTRETFKALRHGSHSEHTLMTNSPKHALTLSGELAGYLASLGLVNVCMAWSATAGCD